MPELFCLSMRRAGCPDAKLTSMDGELFREMHEGDQVSFVIDKFKFGKQTQMLQLVVSSF